MKDDEKNKK